VTFPFRLTRKLKTALDPHGPGEGIIPEGGGGSLYSKVTRPYREMVIAKKTREGIPLIVREKIGKPWKAITGKESSSF